MGMQGQALLRHALALAALAALSPALAATCPLLDPGPVFGRATAARTLKREFGPGTWVWFPEGGRMEHDATATSDFTFLFITNKAFGIDLVKFTVFFALSFGAGNRSEAARSPTRVLVGTRSVRLFPGLRLDA